VPQPRPPFVRPRSTICKKPVLRPLNGFRLRTSFRNHIPSTRNLRWTATGLRWGPKPAVGPNPAHARLKYCMALSCFCAAARDENVPRFFRFPVFASFLREYKRYSPDCSLRIIEKKMPCCIDRLAKKRTLLNYHRAVKEPLSRRCSETSFGGSHMRPRHKPLLIATSARNTAPVMHRRQQLRLISRSGHAGCPNESLDRTILLASTNAGPRAGVSFA
jgi:hypothetical protein